MKKDVEKIKKPCIGIVVESLNNIEYVMQLISKAYELGIKATMRVAVICLTPCMERDTYKFTSVGAEYIYECNLKEKDPIILTNILDEILNNFENMKLLIFMSTILGQEIAARLSIRKNVGLTAECFDIKYEKKQFIFTRAAMNSSIIADIICSSSKISMCTVKRNVFFVKNCTNVNSVKIKHEHNNNEPSENTIHLLERISKDKTKVESLQHAKIVFSCGRGVIESNSLKLVRNVAEKYGAAIACSRVLVEEGYMSVSNQVGQSGISIAPTIYVALGISGACQHIIGIKNASTIIAINHDKFAPIFNYADYKIVANVRDILLRLM